MTAVNSSIPNMPRLEIEKVEPVYSWGCSLFSRARPASSRISVLIRPRPLACASRTTGVIRPSGTATAMPMCTWWKRRMELPCHHALHSGCRVSATAAALMIMSLSDAFAPCAASSSLILTRACSARVMSTSTVRKKWGTGPSDSVRRRATVLRICDSGRSSNSTSGADGTATGGAAAAAFAAASMSLFITRPPGPDPCTAAMSRPRSPASRRATGDAFTRPVAVVEAAAAVATGAVPAAPADRPAPA